MVLLLTSVTRSGWCVFLCVRRCTSMWGLRAPLGAVPQVPSILCFETLARKSPKRAGWLVSEPQSVGSQHSIAPSFHTGVEFGISGCKVRASQTESSSQVTCRITLWRQRCGQKT